MKACEQKLLTVVLMPGDSIFGRKKTHEISFDKVFGTYKIISILFSVVALHGC